MAARHWLDFGGYNCSFVKKELDKFTCSVCTNVLRDPHLTGCCGQVFCESCLTNWFNKHRQESCPHCRAEGEEFQHFLDKRLKREINSLKIHCTNKEEGCQWIGELGSLVDHLESADGCGFVEVDCPNKCKNLTKHNQQQPLLPDLVVVTVKRKDLEYHLKNKCHNRPYQCEYCGRKGTYLYITGKSDLSKQVTVASPHCNVCPEFPMECPNFCGRKNLKRKDIKDHCNQCPEERIDCPNKCQTDKGRLMSIRRKYLEKHLADTCKLRPHHCEHCGMKDTYEEITTKHYNKCPEFSQKCPNKCSVKEIKRKDMQVHRSQCPKEPVQCPFEEVGCKKGLVRRELEQHLTATQQQHLLMMLGAYKVVKLANEEMMRENREMKIAYAEIKKDNEQIKKRLAEHEEKLLTD